MAKQPSNEVHTGDAPARTPVGKLIERHVSHTGVVTCTYELPNGQTEQFRAESEGDPLVFVCESE